MKSCEALDGSDARSFCGLPDGHAGPHGMASGPTPEHVWERTDDQRYPGRCPYLWLRKQCCQLAGHDGPHRTGTW